MLKGRLGRAFILCLLGTSIAGAPAATAGDVVTDWGARAVAIGAEKQLPNARFTRGLAMVHVAMFEAVNAIDRRYKPYKLDLAAQKGASREAAAATAAHDVLVSLFPEERAKLDQALQAALAAIEGDAKTKGIELGRKAATGIIALRADDGSNIQESYRPFTKPGVYVHTALPIEITSGMIKPWTMEKGSQFRPQPPPALDSEVWTRDVNEIRELGSSISKTRTQEQTQIGRFWFLTGPRTYIAAGAAGCRSQEDGPRRLRTAVRPRLHGNERRVHRRLRCEVRAQFLAPDHGNPQCGPHLQSGHTARGLVDPAWDDPTTSRVSLCALHRGRRSGRGAEEGGRRRRGRAHAHERGCDQEVEAP